MKIKFSHRWIAPLSFLITLACSSDDTMSQLPELKTDLGYIASDVIADVAVPGISNSHEILIDRAGQVNLCCFWDKGDPEIKLIDPHGNVIDTTSKPDDFFIDFTVRKIPEMDIMGCFALTGNYPVGVWTLTISLAYSASEKVDYSIQIFYEEPELNIQSITDKEYPKTDEPITLTTIIRRKSKPVLDATVIAIIVMQREEIDTLMLYDDGKHNDSSANDGRYAAEYRIPSREGYYVVRIKASKSGDEAFERIDATGFMVAANKSTIESPISERVIDTNDDGLYDELILSVGFDIAQKDYYELQARLYDRNDKMIFNAYIETVLNAGHQIVDFSFDGNKIYKHGIEGPYILKSLVLADTLDFIPLLDYEEDVYTTKKYSYRDFQHDAIDYSGNYTFVTVDSDNDGLYDSLAFIFEADLADDYHCSWQAQLHDDALAPIDFTFGDGSLNSGAAKIRFTFDGAKIHEHGVDGPYLIIGINVYNNKGNTIRHINNINTPAYRYKEFE